MADRQGHDGSHRYLKLVSFLALVILVAGCGSGAVTSPDDKGGSSQIGQGGGGQGGGGQGGGGQGGGGQGGGGQGGGGQGGGGQGGGGQGGGARKYSWDLPAGDTSPTGNEGSMYGALMSCQGAEQTIAEAWSGFNSPRNVLMYMAAAHLCHGDVSGGRPFYNRAVSEYGLAGLWADTRPCDTYRSVASVLLQAPRESFTCPEGRSPEWKSGPGGQDNPLTFDVDESQQSDSTSEETATSQADESQQSDSTLEETATSQAEAAG